MEEGGLRMEGLGEGALWGLEHKEGKQEEGLDGKGSTRVLALHGRESQELPKVKTSDSNMGFSRGYEVENTAKELEKTLRTKERA